LRAYATLCFVPVVRGLLGAVTIMDAVWTGHIDGMQMHSPPYDTYYNEDADLMHAQVWAAAAVAAAAEKDRMYGTTPWSPSTTCSSSDGAMGWGHEETMADYLGAMLDGDTPTGRSRGLSRSWSEDEGPYSFASTSEPPGLETPAAVLQYFRQRSYSADVPQSIAACWNGVEYPMGFPEFYPRQRPTTPPGLPRTPSPQQSSARGTPETKAAKPAPAPTVGPGEETTLMIRHVPKGYTQATLLEELKQMGFLACVDFFYLPIDFRSSKNVGYCFVNFTTPDAATRFRSTLDGKHMKLSGEDEEEKRPVDVCPARLQGRQANIEHFRNSAVMLDTISQENKPILFDAATGERLPMPAPNAAVRKKTLRKARALAVGA